MAIHQIRNINVSNDIRPCSKIVIDTNVLLFIHGGYMLSGNNNLKANAYANLINDLKNNHNEIFVSIITLQELFHVIEDKEYKLFLTTHHNANCTKKQFRANTTLRQDVKQKILSIYTQINNFYTIPDCCEIKHSDVRNFINTYDAHKFDPMDYVLTKNFDCYDDIYYVTDDKDFSSNPSLEVISY